MSKCDITKVIVILIVWWMIWPTIFCCLNQIMHKRHMKSYLHKTSTYTVILFIIQNMDCFRILGFWINPRVFVVSYCKVLIWWKKIEYCAKYCPFFNGWSCKKLLEKNPKYNNDVCTFRLYFTRLRIDIYTYGVLKTFESWNIFQ